MKTGSQQDYYTVANEAALDLSVCIPISMQLFLYSKFVFQKRVSYPDIIHPF